MRKFIASFSAFVLVMMMLSACTSGDKSATTDTGNSSNTENQDHDGVTVGYHENVQTLDPHDASSGIDISVLNSMYESLLTPNQDGELEPLLATDYKTSDDGLTYTFELRKGVKFTDGTTFNAKAVKANIERILDSDGSLNAYKDLSGIKNVKVTGDHEIKITLKELNSQFLSKIGTKPIANPKTLDSANYAKTSTGTGPFKLKKWNHGTSVVVVKNENYWKNGNPKVDKITFKPIPENGSRVAMLKTGELDVIFPVPVNNVKELQKADGIKVDLYESTYVNYTTINTSKELFSSKKVRKAMNYAINKEAYSKVVKNGFAKKVSSPLPKTNVNFTAQEPYAYNLEKAKQLMKEAGYADGFSATIWGSNSSKDKKGMQFIKQQLKQINIDVTIKQFERGTLSEKINKPKSPEDSKVQMWYVGWSSTPRNTDNALNPLFSTSAFPANGANTAYYSNPQVDKLIKGALHAKTKEEKQKKYDKVQKIIWDDAPWLFLATDVQQIAMNENLTGAWRSADGNLYIKNVAWK
ncbi:ABC transporter substrate-binding protein [Tuberibacillus sp. Marseille-P3662]|uniref:ABC transporter substrate-binding protein n=1 Tax=Tuberibacillus sp. Marseille-P3662 TaxID=1965358 RepID=UPI000A1C7A94|nr:ABC transporter substrate-binding protein [Tuberibacillus sp. Marseille-P3662]